MAALSLDHHPPHPLVRAGPCPAGTRARLQQRPLPRGPGAAGPGRGVPRGVSRFAFLERWGLAERLLPSLQSTRARTRAHAAARAPTAAIGAVGAARAGPSWPREPRAWRPRPRPRAAGPAAAPEPSVGPGRHLRASRGSRSLAAAWPRSRDAPRHAGRRRPRPPLGQLGGARRKLWEPGCPPGCDL